MASAQKLPDDVETLKRMVIELRSQLARLGHPVTSGATPQAPTAEQLELTLEKEWASRTLPRGAANPALTARVLVGKYLEHVPLHRQSRLYARRGMKLDRSTLSDWVAGAHAVLEPLIEALGRQVLEGSYLHGADTPYPVRAARTGKARTGRLWVYVRDERASGSARPAAALFRFSPDRTMRHVRRHLASFKGVLHTSSAGTFDRLFAEGRIREAASWPELRKAFLDLHEAEPSATAAEALARIDALLTIEAEVRGRSPEMRNAARRERAAPLLADLQSWLAACTRELPGKSVLAATVRDTLARWEPLTRYVHDGCIDADNESAERALRAIGLARRSHLFVGADSNGERAADLYSLMVSAALNDLDPEAYLRNVLGRIGDQPIHRMEALLPGMT